MNMHRVAIGIGSNIGDRLLNIKRSLTLAGEMAGRRIAVSSVYESPPWGVTAQPRFLNACALLETELSPCGLLLKIKEMESKMGRIERMRWGPREIDLDILLYDDLAFSDNHLTVPHINMHERAFVLVPLNEIAPDWVHPKTGKSAAELLDALPDASDIVRIVDI